CLFCFYVFACSVDLRDLHSFPTRRSSDLCGPRRSAACRPNPVPPARCSGWNGCCTSRSFHRSRWSGSASDSCTSSAPGIQQSARSEEHTSELQSRENLVCRLLLEKKKKNE